MSDTNTLLSAINSWDESHPFHAEHLKGPRASYTFRPWTLKEYSHNKAERTYRFVFENKSSGTYTARPWYVKGPDGIDYKIQPRTKIEVGSLPVMRLMRRAITPNNRNTVPVKVFRGEHGAAPSSIINYYQDYYKKIQTIVVKGERKYSFPYTVRNEENRKSFMDNAVRAVIEFISDKEGIEYVRR